MIEIIFSISLILNIKSNNWLLELLNQINIKFTGFLTIGLFNIFLNFIKRNCYCIFLFFLNLLFLFGFFLLFILIFQFFILVIFDIKVTKSIWLSLIHSLAVILICEWLEFWNRCLSAWDSILFRKIMIILIIKIRNNRICIIFCIIRKVF